MSPPVLCRSVALALSALLLFFATAPVQAGPVLDRVTAAASARVCIWPDYYGVTFRSPRTQRLGGIDVDLSLEFARELGVKVVHVDSSFPKLIDDLVNDRCGVAMFAIGALPQRQAALKFSQLYPQSDVCGGTTRSNRAVSTWVDIDKPGVQVAVQAGTFMEPVMAAGLKQAKLVVVRPPQTREQELEAARVDVGMTDYPYSRLLDNAGWARLVSPTSPYHVLPYAHAVKPRDEEWLRRVDEFVARINRDGRLQDAARRHGLTEIVVLK